MTVVYKLIGAVLSIGMLVSLFQSPVHAAVSPQCQALETKRQKLSSDIAAKEAPLTQLRIKNTYNNTQAPVLLKTKISNLQKDSDKKRLAILKKLENKAKTEAQKTALKVFEAEVAANLQTLRVKQETARVAYYESINGLTGAHRSAVDTQLAVLKKQIDTAFNKAAAQCKKIGAEKVSAQLRNDIKLAQDSYILAPNVSIKSIQASLQAATENFKTNNDKATVAFNESLLQSKGKLKIAFGAAKYIF